MFFPLVDDTPEQEFFPCKEVVEDDSNGLSTEDVGMIGGFFFNFLLLDEVGEE